MNKKQFLDNRPFTVKDSTEMQDWIENAIKENIKNVYSYGILDGFEVESNNNFTVKVTKGRALDENFNYIKTEKDSNLSIDSADSLDRIDIITLKFVEKITNNTDTNNRYGKGTSWVISKNVLDYFELKVIKGTPSSNPTEPSIPENELALASIFIGAGKALIEQDNIEDKREIAKIHGEIGKEGDGIIQQEEIPDGIEEGRLWLDTSDETFQGTVFEKVKWIEASDTIPEDLPVGGIWADTSDNVYQGTVFEGITQEIGSLTGELAAHKADYTQHIENYDTPHIYADKGEDPDFAGVKYRLVVINGEPFIEVVEA